jgi:cell division protein FtsW
MRLTRADRSVLSDWWFTVDRLMFFGLLLLMGLGLVLSFAASPPIAAKYDLEPFHFVRRHAQNQNFPQSELLFKPGSLADS